MVACKRLVAETDPSSQSKVLKTLASTQREQGSGHGATPHEHGSVISEVPCVEAGTAAASACTLYGRHGLLLIKKTAHDSLLPGFEMLARLFKDFPEIVEKTWCVENKQSGNLSPVQVYGMDSFLKGSYYSSFLMQGNQEGLSQLLEELPFSEPSVYMSGQGGMIHEDCAWVFFGSNQDSEVPLLGRPEHTDSVEHAGTWHIQCSGTKTWNIRPLDDIQLWSDAGCWCPKLDTPADSDGHSRLHVKCEAGDLLVINTRLWYHQTELPHSNSPSLSVARDFRWAGDGSVAGQRAAAMAMSSEPQLGNAYVAGATAALEEGAVIFKERPLLAIQTNKREYLSCDRCAVPIGPPSLHLALLRGKVSRKAIRTGKATRYKDWLPKGVQPPEGIALPQVREVVPTSNGLFCSEACASKGCAKSMEVEGFAERSWELESEPIQPFLIAYIERIADAGAKWPEAAAAICKAFNRVVPSSPEVLADVLSEILDELCEAPGWKGRVLYERMNSVQAGLEWPEPNVTIEFEYDMEAVLMTTRSVPAGEDFNMIDMS